MTLFRPCIDLHNGHVKQIVGASLVSNQQQVKTNFVADESAAYYSELYKCHGLEGGHVIMLGSGNEEAAIQALQAWPQGLQVGGGITAENAQSWLDRGASKVIVTSFLFPDGLFNLKRLQELSKKIGKERLVIDLSCKRVGKEWIVAMNKWQALTDTNLSKADVEGLCQGMDEDLIKALGEWLSIPCTYAGGGKVTIPLELGDLDLVQRLSDGKLDLTFGSALDIFGGAGVKFLDAVNWNASHSESNLQIT